MSQPPVDGTQSPDSLPESLKTDRKVQFVTEDRNGGGDQTINQPEEHERTIGEDNDGLADGDGEQEIDPADLPDAEPVKKKKKSKKKKPKSQRGQNAPTGFEEYAAEGPITPEQHAEEQLLYDPRFKFTNRIEKAIHRFEKRRKMSPEMRDVFYKYLAYGGIDVGPNMFQGAHSKQELEGIEKDDLKDILAQAHITDPTDNEIGKDPEKWVVDFEGCMNGFL